MAAAAPKGAKASPAAAPAAEGSKASGPQAKPESQAQPAADQTDSGKKRWWKKQKPEPKDTGF